MVPTLPLWLWLWLVQSQADMEVFAVEIL